MTICIGNYRRIAEAAGQKPDEQLLQPIAEVFAALDGTASPEGAAADRRL